MTANSKTGVSRRNFIVDSAALVTAVPFAAGAKAGVSAIAESPSAGHDAVKPVVPPKTAPFSPADVRLLDGPFKFSRDAAARYLLSLNVDCLVAPYRIEASLKPKAPPYLGWETNSLP